MGQFVDGVACRILIGIRIEFGLKYEWGCDRVSAMRKKRIGKIIKAGDVNPWPHEEATAKTLALCGHDVEFIRKSNRDREHSADAYVDGVKWEFKSPTANHTRTILKNLKDAKWQSDRVIIDARRMKKFQMTLYCES